jgi:hypothetical protein
MRRIIPTREAAATILVIKIMYVPIIGIPFISGAAQRESTSSSPWIELNAIPIEKVAAYQAARPAGTAMIHRSKLVAI